MAMTERDAQHLQAPLLAACWAADGFDIKRPQLAEAKNWPREVECSYIACDGDVCGQKTLKLRLHAGGKLSLLPKGLASRLLTQPLALAVVVAMLTLGCSCAVPSAATDAIIALVGGRQIGTYIFAAAVLAHVAEAAYTFHVVTSKLRQPLGTALGWAVMVALVGFPITRRVLKLKKVAGGATKAA